MKQRSENENGSDFNGKEQALRGGGAMSSRGAAKKALRRLLDGLPLNGTAPTECGYYAEHIEALDEALTEGGPDAVETVARALRAADDSFDRLVSESGKTEGKNELNEQSVPCTLDWRPFPADTLPQVTRDFVRAQSAALNVDPAMVAVPTLAVLAAAVGNSRQVQLKQSWQEPSTLWVCVVGRSGTLKSPAYDAALRPVYALEADLKEQFKVDRTRYEALSEEEKADAERPVRTRLRVGDTTAESVVRVHADNARGLLLARDELGGWIGGFDRYASGSGADLQNWIEMYHARPVVIDRKSGSPPVLSITRPAVSVVGGIQPGILRKKLSEEHFSSGFAARLMLAWPPERKRRWTEADVTEETLESYHRLIRRLYKRQYEGGEPTTLQLTRPAKDRFAAFVNSNAELQEKLPGGPLRSLLSKIEAVAARLSLVLQVADDPAAGEVSEGAMQKGVRLAEWLRYEAARIYQKEAFEKQAKSRDERLAAGLPEEFGWSDVADLWGVSRRGAYKVINRLTGNGLAEDAGHGQYRRCPRDSHRGTVHFVHFFQAANNINT